jgi:O-antigen/teichoic acid export membrane protein
MTSFRTPPRTIAELVTSAAVTALFTMAYIIYTGRALGPAQYADFAAGLSVIYFVGVALSPLTPSVSRLCARYLTRGDAHGVAALRRRLTLTVAVVGSVVAVGCVAGAPVIAPALQFRSASPLVLALLIAVFYAQVSADRGVIHGLLLFRVHNVNTVFEALIRCGLAAALFRWRATAGSALAAYLIALVAAELLLALRLRGNWSHGPVSVDWSEVRKVFLPITILMVAVAAFQNSDMLVVKSAFAPPAAGAYGAATALARAVGILFVPLYVVVSPILSGLHESGQPVFRVTLLFVASFLGLVAVPLTAIAGWSRPIVTLLYGAAFRDAAPLLLPLAGIAVLMYATLMLSQTLITIADHAFLPIYAVLALLQIGVLLRFHATFSDVFHVLYAVESVALVAVAICFFAAWSRQGSRAR